jgi:phosphoglucosamine mutase
MLKDVTLFPQKMINVRLTPGQDWKASPQLPEVSRDVEAELGETGRILIRASGTEPVVRVMVEAQDAHMANQCARRLADAIQVPSR